MNSPERANHLGAWTAGTPVCGIPLGADGLVDRNTAFNSFLPSGAPVGMTNVSRDHVPDFGQPFLGLAVDGKVWKMPPNTENRNAEITF